MGGQATGAARQVLGLSSRASTTSGAWSPAPAPVAASPSSLMTNSSIDSGFGGYNGQSAANAAPQQNPYQPPQMPWQLGTPWSSAAPVQNSYPPQVPWQSQVPSSATQAALSQPTPTLQSIQQQQANQARGGEMRFTTPPVQQYQENDNFYSWGSDRRFL